MPEPMSEDRIAALLLRFVANPAGRGQIAAEFLRLTAENAELTRQLAGAQKDSERLDWLEAHPFTAYRNVDFETNKPNNHFTLVDESKRSRTGIVKETFRAAIDAARQEKP